MQPSLWREHSTLFFHVLPACKHGATKHNQGFCACEACKDFRRHERKQWSWGQNLLRSWHRRGWSRPPLPTDATPASLLDLPALSLNVLEPTAAGTPSLAKLAPRLARLGLAWWWLIVEEGGRPFDDPGRKRAAAHPAPETLYPAWHCVTLLVCFCVCVCLCECECDSCITIHVSREVCFCLFPGNSFCQQVIKDLLLW